MSFSSLFSTFNLAKLALLYQQLAVKPNPASSIFFLKCAKRPLLSADSYQYPGVFSKDGEPSEDINSRFFYE
jgi:hypothetical protein